nr:hypothetical protein [Tanacetum cinerariifolium]
MDKDAKIYSDVHVEDQNSPIIDKEDLLAEYDDQDSPYLNMDKDAKIYSDVLVEDQNSPIIDKEDLLAEYDGIKVKNHIIDKRKGEVATSCLEKELDLVKEKTAVIKKALKLRYQDRFKDFVQQVCYKQHELGGSKSTSAVSDVFHQVVASETYDCTGECSDFIYAESQYKFSIPQLLQLAINEKSRPIVDCTQLEEWSVGFDNVLDPGCKDELANDNDQEGLVKLVDIMSTKEHISANILDEKGQASPRLTAMKVQQPPSDHHVYAEVCVDVHVDHV